MPSLTNGASSDAVLNGVAEQETPFPQPVNGTSHGAPYTNGSTKSNGAMNGVIREHTNGHTNGDGKQNGIGHNAPEPIAIVGMALRLPGGIRSPEALWNLLLNKQTTRGLVPADRYNVEAFYSSSKRVGSVGMKHGHFLDENLEHIDTSFFTMSKAEIDKVDPQQRMLLEVVWECMESAGQTGWRGTETGVFVGSWGEDWIDLAAKDTQRAGVYDITGFGDFALSNRVSYEYDLRGPSVTIRTACSSSSTALHEACVAIQTGNCSGAIVGGTNLILTPTMSTTQSESGVLSPTGECKTFDAAANGYARGEAINALYIKKLSDAIRDNDPIRAVITGSGTNCDGRSNGITMPNPEAHEALIRKVYKNAHIDDFADTTFVECHGTGTAAGDPVELKAIGNIFGGEKGVWIGGVKPNVGHSEGASGITSIIKATLALENRTIPPQANYTNPNPKIPFKQQNLRVPTQPVPWPQGGKERISVNSFGVGGANAHIVLDSAAEYGIVKTKEPLNDIQRKRSHLLVSSASNGESLKHGAAAIQEYAKENFSKLEDLAFTLANRRDHLANRGFSIAHPSGEIDPLTTSKTRKAPQVVFIFTGQGAQWPAMASELIQDFPSFKADIRAMDDVLASLPEPPSWSIYEELRKLGHESNLDQAEFAQPLCTVVQVALVNLLRDLGITPSAVAGHSSGEIGAAYASGAITSKEAVVIAYYRGLVTKQSKREGAMAAVGLGRAEVSLYLERGVVVACENSPSSVTLSGDIEVLEEIIEQLKYDDPDVFARKLKTGGMAYHSHHMLDLGETYENYLKQHVNAQSTTVPFYSSVTSKLITDLSLGPSYWRQNLESPVLFYPAVKSLIDDQDQDLLFLEVGPHSALAGPLRQIFKATVAKLDLSYASVLARGEDSSTSLLKAVGQLHIQNVAINFRPLTPNGQILTNLPRYPWRHDKSFWEESRVSREWRFRKFPHHEILGNRILEGSDLQPTWRNVLRLKDVPWIPDHKVLDDIVFPAAGYIAMACEAARQLSGAEDFSLNHIDIQTALVLQDSQTTEMITALKPVRLTSSLDSEWYEFSVSSYDGHHWIKHCAGSVRPGTDPHAKPESKLLRPFPRIINAPYSAMKRMGLNYGPSFQGLETVSSLPAKQTAYASLRIPEPSESWYALHPSTIDNCLQLFAFAASEGISRHMDKLCIPTHLDRLYINTRSSDKPIFAEASTSSGRSKGTLQGNALITDGEQVLFSLMGGKFSPLDNGDPFHNTDTVAAARLEWAPDMDFLDPASLMIQLSNDPKAIQEIEKYTILTMLEMQHQLQGVSFHTEHMVKYKTWLDDQILRASKGQHQLVDDDVELTQLARDDRINLLAKMTEELKTSELAAGAELIDRLLKNTVGIFDGTTEALEVYLADNGLTNVYNIMADRLDSVGFMRAAGHNNPTLRVLEIGAGTGGTTVVALDGLSTENAERMYSKYTYTDISSGFFGTAQQRFAAYQGLEYKVLDIGKDPAEQGFEVGTYDLIIASNVIHATPELNTTLRNVRKLLQPNGRFFLQELLPSAPQFMHLIMGVLPGWWLGEADGRPNEPIVSIPRWRQELLSAGFAGIEAAVFDDERDGFHICANIIARPAKQESTDYKGVTLLYQQQQRSSQLTADIRGFLTSQGFTVDDCVLGETPRSSQDVISLLDLESPFIDEIKEEEFEQFKELLDSIGTSGILWVTKTIQMGCVEPQHSLFLGLARTIRSELSVPIATLEIDTVSPVAFDAIVKVFGKFQSRDVSGQIDPDWEYALHNEKIHIGRYHWIATNDELALQPAGDKEQAVKLEIGQRGLLNTLRWVQYPLAELGPYDVVVDPRTVGINFKDILVTMGIVDDEGAGLGLEGAGIVRAVGSEVKHLKAGDRYMTMGITNFSTRKVGPAEHFVKIPDTLSFEDAATMPCVYSTVIYGLIHEARLRKGQKILIHSACGGVGIAAINLAKMIGAEIFATVGSEEKIEYLQSTFGIPRAHIFHSRDASFLPDILKATKGRGVDVLLNSLSGELLHASWKAIAPRGKMIEIGRRDFNGRAQLSMDLFEANRSFIGVNLAALGDLYHELLTETVELYEAGHIKPIHPIHAFAASEAEEAFRFMQKGQHIGKLVVSIPENDTNPDLAHSSINIQPTKRPLALDPTAIYLLAGGTGGLGKAIATYLIENGARHLVFLSRSAGLKDTDKGFFAELESQDCKVDAVAGSSAILEDVRKAVSVATQAGKRLAGVLQLSMVLQDLPLQKMTHADWRIAIEPKVDGTWNLHKALLEVESNLVDFFVMFSSALGNFGAAHQSNYAAGNTFQDAFVQYRHNLGLPASVLDVGVMSDIGYVSQNLAVENNMRTTGMWFLTEQDLLDALHLTILTGKAPATPHSGSDAVVSKGQLGIGFRSTKPLADPSNRVLWRRDKRMSIYRNMEASNSTSAAAGGAEHDELEALLTTIEGDPKLLNTPDTISALTNEIGLTIYRFMLQPVEELDIHKSLSALGVDSLVTIEIRNWLRRRLNIEVTTLEILSSGGGTIESLGAIAVERLKTRLGLDQTVEAPAS